MAEMNYNRLLNAGACSIINRRKKVFEAFTDEQNLFFSIFSELYTRYFALLSEIKYFSYHTIYRSEPSHENLARKVLGHLKKPHFNSSERS